MDFYIEEVRESDKKSEYAEKVLRRLPEWFGNEKALYDFSEGVSKLPFWAAKNPEGDCIGFLSVKIHYGHTGDIYVCGILPEYHHKGIGRKMFMFADNYFKENGCKYVIVKTLSDIAGYEPYEKIRSFYLNIGFEPLLTLTEMWDEENPCLILIKNL